MGAGIGSGCGKERPGGSLGKSGRAVDVVDTGGARVADIVTSGWQLGWRQARTGGLSFRGPPGCAVEIGTELFL